MKGTPINSEKSKNKDCIFDRETEAMIKAVYGNPGLSLEELVDKYDYFDYEQFVGQYKLKKEFPTEIAFRQHFGAIRKKGLELIDRIVDGWEK